MSAPRLVRARAEELPDRQEFLTKVSEWLLQLHQSLQDPDGMTAESLQQVRDQCLTFGQQAEGALRDLSAGHVFQCISRHRTDASQVLVGSANGMSAVRGPDSQFIAQDHVVHRFVLHEISNLFFVLHGTLELLVEEEEEEGGQHAETLATFRGGVDRMCQFLHKYLGVSMPDSIQGSPDYNSLSTTIKFLTALFHNVTIRSQSLPRNAEATLPHADWFTLLFNMIHNARKAGATEVRFSIGLESELWVADLRDNGQGFAAPPNLSPSAPSEPGATHGNGLRICAKICSDAGGSLSYIPSKSGAHFQITLPLAPE